MSISVSDVGTQTQVQQENSKQKSKFWKGAQNVGAVGAAYLGTISVNLFGEYLLSEMSGEGKTFSQGLFSVDDANLIFKKSGLLEKGVVIRDLSGCTNTSAPAFFKDIQLKNKLKENFDFRTYLNYRQNKTNLSLEKSDQIVKDGKNSFYLYKHKEICINLEKRACDLPHELGHAKNFTSKGVGKVLSKMRGLSLLTVPILLVALFRKPKDKREESTTFVGKSLDFVKDNAVALTAACNAPIVLEEGLASIKGARMAKGILSPEKLKAMKKMDFKAWCTHAVAAGIAVAGVWAANKIKNWLCTDDTLDNSKAVKTDNIQENKAVNTIADDISLETVA